MISCEETSETNILQLSNNSIPYLSIRPAWSNVLIASLEITVAPLPGWTRNWSTLSHRSIAYLSRNSRSLWCGSGSNAADMVQGLPLKNGECQVLSELFLFHFLVIVIPSKHILEKTKMQKLLKSNHMFLFLFI